MLRQGANELHNALRAFPQSQQGVDQPGTPLQPTQLAVNQRLGITQSFGERLRAQPIRQANKVKP